MDNKKVNIIEYKADRAFKRKLGNIYKATRYYVENGAESEPTKKEILEI